MIELSLDAFAKALASREATCVSAVALAPGERASLVALCRERHVRLIDAIDRQLDELAAVRSPSGSSHERRQWVESALADAGASEALGKWIYLPWEGTITHLLDRDDYFDVLVSRNQDKITRDEQKVLRTKRVGVLGLSVGGEAAVSVAQEHLCGSIVLADFDALELSNLNRLGASFTELGDNKAVIVSRRIAKIDPYLDVTVYEDGVTAENMDAFLDGLDLLVEECDDLGLKHAIRERARERGLDVVFAADERGFLSVEPYSRYRELAPFHGRVPERQRDRADYESPRAFMRALTEWLGGWEEISERSRGALERIGETLVGYPQLASEARFAAGQIGHVARRLLLGDRLAPFVGHVDLDAIVESK